jgi:hypothetical protein
MYYKAEGRPVSPKLMAQYRKTADRGESYADWSRRQEIAQYFDQMPLPGENWAGWSPAYDLEDLKMKVVQTMGEDIHEYGMWRQQERQLRRKPYIGRGDTLDNGQMLESVERVMKESLNMDNVQVHAMPSYGPDTIEFDVEDRRVADIRSILKETGEL